ncbi:MAG TPA: PAS domain S-box protein [Desulfobacteraceae bacterium]|nr:PAS domain S-box protein [Desulfobacteraceae bacterium]
MDSSVHKDLQILKHAVDNAVEGFVTIDENHNVIFFNKAAERIFGYSKDEVLGRDLDEVMSPACSKNHHEAVARYVETRTPTRIGHESEMIATRKNGETFPALISFSVTELEGRLFFTGIVRDLTETKKLQEKLIRSEKLAGLGQSVAEITHEIKNPLMLIGGFAQQLSRTITDRKDLRKVQIITREIERLERLLAELRDYYLPSSIAAEKVDLEDLKEDTLSLIKKECDVNHVQVRFDVAERARFVIGDANKLKQVLFNLYKNSIDSMEHGGTLTISARPAGDGSVKITIADEGCGIPETDRDSIFSPFFTTKSSGTGLGLAVSKRIIDQHKGGSLSVESEEGKGTTFTITLPSYHDDLGAGEEESRQ